MSSPFTNQDGWLIQGSVPNIEVTDPMYMEITNISTTCDAFFQAIPYGGPQVQLTGPQPYETVSNAIALEVEISDLSGVSFTGHLLWE